MDPRLLRYYERELQFMREMGSEFAREFPKIAGRLGLEGFDCADPYVERLLEGFSFMAARVQLKLDARFPQFTQHLLEMVHPNYLSPSPSMAIVQLQPDLTGGTPPEGLSVPRGTILRSRIGKGEQTSCEYRTAHPLTLWPLQVTEAEYVPNAGALGALGIPDLPKAQAGLRIRLSTAGEVPFAKMPLDRIAFHLQGADEAPVRVFEQVVANATAVVVRPGGRRPAWHHVLPRTSVRPIGLSDDEALLPTSRWGFQGYRLLQEYYACPERLLFFELAGLLPAVARCEGEELEIVVVLDRRESALDRVIHADNLAPFCTPAVNLFPRRADRIQADDRSVEYHVIPDRTRPRDFEVYSVTKATGFDTNGERMRDFFPFYSLRDRPAAGARAAYFALRREPRLLGERERRDGPRSNYLGSEVYISLVEPAGDPYRGELRHLGLDTLCTNRDLPLQMAMGEGTTDFTLEAGLPVESVRSLNPPTRPRGTIVEGELAWRLISQLSLNYLSLLDGGETSAGPIRELLRLYVDETDARTQHEIDGIRSVVGKRVVDRVPGPGPATFARGLEITLDCDEAAFRGAGVFPLAMVLEEFFARYVSINSFTKTVLRTTERGEIMKWPARIGRRQTI